MNEEHQQLCSSPEWADFLATEVLGPLLSDLDLGEEMLELGPGPGAATDWLGRRVGRLVALELEPEAAARLQEKHAGENVEVLVGDSSHTPFEDASFDSVASFTMFHHLPTSAVQYATLAEALRVLRPGGVLVGSDSLASTDLHAFHTGDTYNPLDPARLLVWLQALGYRQITVAVHYDLRFVAHAPSPDDDQCE